VSCARGCCATQADHFRSVAVATKALVQENRREQVLSKDLGAYRRMIDSGLEPQRIDGCAELEARQAPAHEIEGGLPSGFGQ
jgi:hypothetical protein